MSRSILPFNFDTWDSYINSENNEVLQESVFSTQNNSLPP